MGTKEIWEGPDIPKAQVTVFHRRFSGSVSLEQELEDLTPHMPVWARPLWKLLLSWLKPKIRETKIQATMREVDRQAKEIGDAYALAERKSLVEKAVVAAKAQNPTAHVEVVEMPRQSLDAVMIEHPPTPGNKAQEALGFGSIEIRAPFAGWSKEEPDQPSR